MDRVDVWLEPLRAFLVQVGAFLPRLGVGLVVVLVGILLGKAARFAVQKALRAVNFHVLGQRSGIDGFLQKGGADLDTISLYGMIAQWAVILSSLIIAANGMGLEQVTDLLSRAILFLPRVALALLIVTLGAYFARFVANAVQSYCHSAGIGDSDALAKLAQYVIMAFILLIALDQLELGGAIVREAFLIILGGVVLAIALAFGLGGREWAAARLEEWWPSRPAARKGREL